MARLMRARRMALDWTTRHALAGFLWLIAAATAGLAISLSGAASLAGSRIAAAFGAAGLLGFFSNFIIGMSYHLFAAFVVRARATVNAAVAWPAATADRLAYTRARLPVFVMFNGGVAILVVGFLAGASALAEAGATLVAIGGIVYVAATLRTLSFAYRRSTPSPVRASLRNPEAARDSYDR
ncbi:MAG: hypothetical protein ACREPW_00280, partial [Candidatus Binataceae bacterium]